MSSLVERLSRRHLAEPEPEPVLLHRKRIFILPTRHGYLFVALLLFMLVGSINYNNSLGFGLTFLMGSIALVSMLHTHRNLAGLAFQSRPTEPVFQGTDVHYTLLIRNTQRDEKIAITLSGEGLLACTVDVPPRDSANATLVQPAPRRGLHRVTRIKVETHYPLGLFRSWSWVAPDLQALVYPRPEANAPPPQFQPQAQALQQPGQQHSATDPEEITTTRDYRTGDAWKHIAWKQSARLDKLQVKEFSGHAGQSLWLEWQNMSGIQGQEQRLSRLCSWVLHCERNALPYGLDIPGSRREPATGTAHLHACLRILALYGSAGG